MSYYGYTPEHSRAFTVDSFTGDGNTQTFTLSLPKPLSERGLLVVVNGVVQKPVFSYTLDTNSNIFFDEAPDLNAIITVTHLGRPIDLTVPRAGSIQGLHIDGVLYLPDDIYTGQGKDFYLRQDSTNPNTQQSIIWDRGNGVDVYLTYNPNTNEIESNVNIAGATATVVDGFGQISVQGQSTIVSTSTPNIEFEAGSNITITTDASTGKLTFNSIGGGSSSQTINVTVGVDTVGGQATGVFYFNGVEKPNNFEFIRGTQYVFNQSASSNINYNNAEHPLMFSTGPGGDHNGNGHYMMGVTYKLDGVSKTMAQYVSGFGSATSRTIEWIVPSNAPATLYYWCHYHTGQGNSLTTIDGASVLNDLTDVNISAVQTGEVLKWSGSAWVNATDDTGSGSGVTLQQVKAEALKASLIFG